MGLFPGPAEPEVETIRHQIQLARKVAKDTPTSGNTSSTGWFMVDPVPEVLEAEEEEEDIADPLERFMEALHSHEELAYKLQTKGTSTGKASDRLSPETAALGSSNASSPSSITVSSDDLKITYSQKRKYDRLNETLEQAGYGEFTLPYTRYVIPFPIACYCTV